MYDVTFDVFIASYSYGESNFIRVSDGNELYLNQPLISNTNLSTIWDMGYNFKYFSLFRVSTKNEKERL
jgi:hypothetical protein